MEFKMEDNLGSFVVSPANTAAAKSLYRFRTKYPKYCGIRMGMHPNVTTIQNNPMSRAYVLSLMKNIIQKKDKRFLIQKEKKKYLKKIMLSFLGIKKGITIQ